MGMSDGAFFMIEHIPLPNGNHPISSPICPMGVADTLGPPLLVHVVVECPLAVACFGSRYLVVHGYLQFAKGPTDDLKLT